MKLKEEDFLQVIHHTPLVSIDLIIVDLENRILIGKRNNEPAKGFWFVPGGRIRKNESIKTAFERISMAETGNILNFSQTELKGIYEHFYETNFSLKPGISTHYVVIAYKIQLRQKISLKPDNQHENMQWMPINEIWERNDVHQLTKNYFL
jgi:colanic acid biosynthesis protein WcaH